MVISDYVYRNEAGGCGGCKPLQNYGLLCFVKHKNDMHAPAALQKATYVYADWYLNYKFKIEITQFI